MKELKIDFLEPSLSSLNSGTQPSPPNSASDVVSTQFDESDAFHQSSRDSPVDNVDQNEDEDEDEDMGKDEDDGDDVEEFYDSLFMTEGPHLDAATTATTSLNSTPSISAFLSPEDLKHAVVRVPCFIDRSIHAHNLVHYVLEVSALNPAHVFSTQSSEDAPMCAKSGVKTVVRLYSDFVKLSRFLLKRVPKCRVVLPPTFMPKSKKSQTLVDLASDERRCCLERFLRALVLDEAATSVASRVLICFLTRQGDNLCAPDRFRRLHKLRSRLHSPHPPLTDHTQLQPPTTSTTQNLNAAKDSVSNRPLNQPPNGIVAQPSSQTLIQDFDYPQLAAHLRVSQLDHRTPPWIKQGILMKVAWRSCLKDVRVTLDRSRKILSLFCLHASDSAHCVIHAEDIQDIRLHAPVLTSDNSPLPSFVAAGNDSDAVARGFDENYGIARNVDEDTLTVPVLGDYFCISSIQSSGFQFIRKHLSPRYFECCFTF